MKDDEGRTGRVIPFPRPPEPSPDGAPPPEDEHDYAAPLLGLKRRSGFVRKAMLALPRWVTPNGVTVFRALLTVPIALFLWRAAYWPALGILGFAMLLDFVDGALAEARDLKTPLGAFLDPLADKITICGCLIAVAGRLPWPFVPATVAVCVLAVALTTVRIVKMARRRESGAPEPTIAAKPAGKLKLVAETASLLATLLGLAATNAVLVWIGLALLCVALFYAAGSLRSQLRS